MLYILLDFCLYCLFSTSIFDGVNAKSSLKSFIHPFLIFPEIVHPSLPLLCCRCLSVKSSSLCTLPAYCTLFLTLNHCSWIMYSSSNLLPTILYSHSLNHKLSLRFTFLFFTHFHSLHSGSKCNQGCYRGHSNVSHTLCICTVIIFLIGITPKAFYTEEGCNSYHTIIRKQAYV